VHDGRTLLYTASKHDCDPCPLKLRRCPKEPARKIPRDGNEAARELARGLMPTEGYRVSARQRKMIETGLGQLIEPAMQTGQKRWCWKSGQPEPL
jgi:hypothetical protein